MYLHQSFNIQPEPIMLSIYLLSVNIQQFDITLNLNLEHLMSENKSSKLIQMDEK